MELLPELYGIRPRRGKAGFRFQIILGDWLPIAEGEKKRPFPQVGVLGNGRLSCNCEKNYPFLI